MKNHMSIDETELILTEYVNNIDAHKYNVSLIVGDDLGKRNIYLDQVEKHIPVKTVFSPRETEFHMPISVVSRENKIEKRRRRIAFNNLFFDALISMRFIF